MPNQILVLNAPDIELESVILSAKLVLSGFAVILYSDAMGKRSRLETFDTYYEILNESSLVIAVASPALFGDPALVSFIKAAKEDKKLIPVNYYSEIITPLWFSPVILLAPTTDLGWGRLSQILARRLAPLFWQFPDPPMPRIN